MLQSKLNDYVLQIKCLEKYTDEQQVAINGLIDRETQSRSERSIPGLIETTTTPSLGNTMELSTVQALIVSLTSQLSVAQQQHYDPNWQRQPGGPGRGGNRTTPGRGRGGDRQTQGVLGTVDNEVDQQLTQTENPNQTVNKFKNKDYCHTHGYECSQDHDSAHCMLPEKCHTQCATAENPMGGCLLYKQLWQSYCVEVP